MKSITSLRALMAVSIAATAFAAPALAGEQTLPSREEMWRMLQQQQQQINALMRLVDPAAPAVKQALPAALPVPPPQPAQNGAAPAADGGLPAQTSSAPVSGQDYEQLKSRVDELDAKVEATGAMVEETRAAAADGDDRLHIGGYGELHYNGGMKDEIDFHRFVLFFGYDFSDSIRFASELELEHALSGDGEPGEVELEQAYLEFDLPDMQRARGGIILVPVGILNETHEPPTFFGVERNPVETNIIPTTWWEGGAELLGQIGDQGFSYDAFLSSGLMVPTTGASAFLVRSGRQKVAQATARDPAFTGRVKWTGVPGVELAATGQYQADVTQNAGSLSTPATLFETHADIRRGGWGLRALWARWDLYGSMAEAIGRDVQEGWYVEPSYRFDTDIGEFGVFGRYNQWDNAAGDGDGINTWNEQMDFGINFWPHPDVVIKADYQVQDLAPGMADDDRVNLGIGFQYGH